MTHEVMEPRWLMRGSGSTKPKSPWVKEVLFGSEPDYNRHMAKNTPYAVWFAETATMENGD